jgi:predicted nucleic acid-binding protein
MTKRPKYGVAVLDTSPLQALHRGGVLAKLPDLFDRTMLPRAVADETRWSLRKLGAKLVPDLDACEALAVCAVSNDVLRALMVSLFQAYERRNQGKRTALRRVPEVVEYQGKLFAWSGKMQLTHAIPDLEVVSLAKQVGGTAIVDDRRAMRAADDLGVRSLTTREVIAELEAHGSIHDGRHVLDRIELTHYHPTSRPSRAESSSGAAGGQAALRPRPRSDGAP